MKVIGYGLIAIGLAYLFFAFNMDVSVSTPSTYVPGLGSVGGGDVVNLDLIAKRQNHLIVAALVTIVGVLLALFAPNPSTEIKDPSKNRKKNFDGLRDVASDPYRVWLVDFYDIQRNDVLDRFVFDQQTFETLDDALMSAHEIENEKQIKAKEKAEAYRLASEKSQAEWEKDRAKTFGIFIGLFLIILSIFLYTSHQSSSSKQKALDALKKNLSNSFDISLPEQATNVRFGKSKNHQSYLCNGKEEGQILQFETKSKRKEIKDLFSKVYGEGTPRYKSEAFKDEYDWSWKYSDHHYELRMFDYPSYMEVSLCKTKL
jgi:hypothetical protein